MDTEEFKKALEGALKFFPGIQIKPEQELCLESLVVKRKDVLGVLPTGYGKSLIYQLLPKLMSEYQDRNKKDDISARCKPARVNPSTASGEIER